MSRMGRLFGATALVALVPTTAFAHGGHADAFGSLHALMHAVPVAAVLAVAALGVGWSVRALREGSRR